MSVREDYDLPERAPVPHRQWLLMLAIPLAALGLWFVLPDSPVTVVLLAIALLFAVFTGVQRILSSREMNRAPGHHPVRPPSA